MALNIFSIKTKKTQQIVSIFTLLLVLPWLSEELRDSHTKKAASKEPSPEGSGTSITGKAQKQQFG